MKRKILDICPKKNKVFTRDNSKFLCEAADKTYLLKKVVAIMGIAGVCRKDELKDNSRQYCGQRNQSRSFTIVDNENENFQCL